jgi:hypothetical protein
MRFSLCSELQLRPGKTVARLYGDVLEQMMNADRLGFGLDAVIEHFFFPKFSVSTNPTELFAAAAQETARGRFQTMLDALSYHTVESAGGAPHWVAIKNQELFASAVMPHFPRAGELAGVTP